MPRHSQFPYTPDEYESERASNSYLMSVVVLMVGLPLPIINLIASAMFYLANRKSGRFVRWHCTQTLLAQALTLVANATAVYWTLSIVFRGATSTNNYFAYLFTVILFNLIEFAATVYAAVHTRRGNHVVWWFFGPLTELMVKA